MPSDIFHYRSTAPVPWALFSMALVSVAVHLWLGFVSAHDSWMTVFMVAMAAACLSCTANMLRSCTAKGLLTMIGLATTSILVHGAVLISGLIGSGSTSFHGVHGPHGGHERPIVNVGAASDHSVGLIALVVIELCVLIIACGRYSRRSRTESAPIAVLARVGHAGTTHPS